MIASFGQLAARQAGGTLCQASRFLRSTVLVSALALSGQSALAADVFSISATVNGVTTTRGFSNAEDVIMFFSEEAPNLNLGYTPTSIASGVIDFRGLAMVLRYDAPTTALIFSVPSLGVTETFVGPSREDSEELLGDFLLTNGSTILKQIQHELVRVSPVDPTAGNPQSLQSTMIYDDFSAGGFNTTANQPSEGGANKIFMGVRAGTFTSRGISGKAVTVPLSYTIHNTDNPRMQINFSMPISYVQTGGGKVFSTTAGVGLQYPVMQDVDGLSWYVTPRVSYGLVGSPDLGAATQMISGTATSRVTKQFEDFSLTMANLVGYSKSMKLKIADVESDPGVKNLIFKNGVIAEYPLDTQWFGQTIAWQASYAMTNFTGSELYMKTYHEAGLSIGTSGSSGALASMIRVGVTASFGKDYNSVIASMGYEF